MKSIVRIGSPGKRSSPAAMAAQAELNVLDSRVALIQALIPLGLEAVNELLQQEVTALAGPRFQRHGGVPGYGRWGSQAGSVYLADQKVAVTVPRVRDVRRDQEVPLATYQSLRQPLMTRRAVEREFRRAVRDVHDAVPHTPLGKIAPLSTLHRKRRAAQRPIRTATVRERSSATAGAVRTRHVSGDPPRFERRAPPTRQARGRGERVADAGARLGRRCGAEIRDTGCLPG